MQNVIAKRGKRKEPDSIIHEMFCVSYAVLGYIPRRLHFQNILQKRVR